MKKFFFYKRFLRYNLRFNSTATNTKEHSVTVKLSNSKLKFSTGHIARFASGAVELCQNDNTVCFNI